MTLSQSFLISLSMLICFSPIMSLEEQKQDSHVINIDINRDLLVQKLISKNINLFRSIHDKSHMHKASTCMIEPFIFLCFISIVILTNPFLINYLTDGNLSSIISVLLCIPQSLVAILLAKVLHRSFMYCIKCTCNNESANNFFTSDEDVQRHIINKSVLEIMDRIGYRHANEHIYNVLYYELPNNIIENFFDLGARFPTECFGEIIKDCSFEMVKFLVDLGIDINTKDINGRPAIIEAVLNKNFRIIRLLASRNVDAGIADSLGNTVYDYLRQLPEADAQEIKTILKDFKKRLKETINAALTDPEYNFHSDGVGVISEFLA